jgi:hypothetical protein
VFDSFHELVIIVVLLSGVGGNEWRRGEEGCHGTTVVGTVSAIGGMKDAILLALVDDDWPIETKMRAAAASKHRIGSFRGRCHEHVCGRDVGGTESGHAGGRERSASLCRLGQVEETAAASFLAAAATRVIQRWYGGATRHFLLFLLCFYVGLCWCFYGDIFMLVFLYCSFYVVIVLFIYF